MRGPPRQVLAALNATGLPYAFHTGSKHIQIRICERMVGILPIDGNGIEGRAMRNVISQIRRAAKELAQ